MSWHKVEIGSFLKERVGRYKPIEANAMGLKRVEKIDFSGTYHLVDKVTNTDMILVKKGDLLISGINAEKGAVAIYNDDEDAVATIHYSSYEFDRSQINIEYFKWFLISDAFKNLLKETAGNGIKTELKSKHLLPLKIYRPSLKSQEEIVKRIKSEHTIIKRFAEEIENQQTYLQQLRQSILQEVVQGKLCEQNPLDEDVATLLKRIKAERQILIKEGKLKKEKEMPPVTEDEIPFELPKGWAWCRLGEIGQINPRNVCEDEKKVSFIPMASVSSEFGVVPQYEERKWKEVKKAFTHFAENDVALAKITPCFENSKAGVMKGLKNGIGAGTTELHIFRGNSQHIIPDYVYLFFKSPDFLKDGESKMTGSAGQKRVPSDYIKNCLFPLPPLAEQKRIVAKVNKLQLQLNQLESQVQQSREYAEQLLQAVLKEAFEEKGTVYEENEIVSMVAEE